MIALHKKVAKVVLKAGEPSGDFLVWKRGERGEDEA